MPETEINFGLIFDIHRTTLTPAAEGTFGDVPSVFRNVAYPNSRRIVSHPYVQASMLKAIDTFNKKDLDFTVWGGDLINGGTRGTGEQRDLNFSAFVADLATLESLSYYLMGHWDLGAASYTEADYIQFFNNTEGIGSIIPTGADAPDAQSPVWWPTLATSDFEQPCAYSLVINNFKCVWLLAIMGPVGLNAESTGFITGGTESTQMEWFQARLDEAEAASQNVIVFSHQPFKTADAGMVALLKIKHYFLGIAALEALTLPSIVCAGHAHRDNSNIVSNNITYMNLRGDVHALDETDTDRFSHAIVKVTSGNPLKISRIGYGYDWDGSRNYNIETSYVG